jgi:hypothetical protein
MAFRQKTCLAAFLLIIAQICVSQTDPLAEFSDPSRIWGNGVERVIEEAFRQCFITRIINGRIMNIRLPFVQDNERDILLETGWNFFEGGKAEPSVAWRVIEEILESKDFGEYVSALSSGMEKVFIFDMPAQSWSVSEDLFDIARMKAGSYRGLPHRPYVLTDGRGAAASDVYNYLYGIGRVGIDCSGFVWYVLCRIGREGGIDLGSILAPAMGAPRGSNPARFAGTAFFNSSSSQIISVSDEIRNLLPGDIILFRNNSGGMAHSAVIQSVDFEKGAVRYLQCTDEAPLSERGVHDSWVYFDPANPGVSLGSTALQWTQKRFAPFPGEKDSPFSDDGERYRAYGGGRVVRLRALVPVIERLNRR